MICSLIQPNLWVGPTPRTNEDFTHLQFLKITAILNLQDDHDQGYGGIEAERLAAAQVGIVFESVPIEDFNNEALRLRVPECVDVLEGLLQRGHAVYVHCHSGVTRSPTVVAAYLNWCSGWDLGSAIAHVRKCWPGLPIEDVIRNATTDCGDRMDKAELEARQHAPGEVTIDTVRDVMCFEDTTLTPEKPRSSCRRDIRNIRMTPS